MTAVSSMDRIDRAVDQVFAFLHAYRLSHPSDEKALVAALLGRAIAFADRAGVDVEEALRQLRAAVPKAHPRDGST